MTATSHTLAPTRVAETSAYAALIRLPGETPSTPYIPSPGLEDEVRTLLMQHTLPRESLGTPRMLVVQGAPGTGKTEIVSRTALDCGFALMTLPPSIFAGKHEGDGIKALDEALDEISRYSRQSRVRAAVLFDDIDHSILSVTENTGHTTNTASTVGHLQALANDRGRVMTYEGLPVPFLVTANAPERIVSSLFRPMRARVVTHKLDESTKFDLAHTLLAPSGEVEKAYVDKLFKRFRTEPIAFWPALASDYRAARIAALIRDYGFDPRRVAAAMADRTPLDQRLLTTLADSRKAARPGNFL